MSSADPQSRDADWALSFLPRRVRARGSDHGLGYLGQAIVLAIVYALLARVGLRIHAVNAFATLVWPASGAALAAILILGFRFWPAITLGAFVANLWTGAPVPVAIGIAAGNTLEAVAAAAAVRRIPGFRSSLDRVVDVVGLISLAGVAAAAVGATIGVSSLRFAGILPPARLEVTWRAWWLGDAIGMLIVGSLLLTLGRHGERRSPPRIMEATALTVLILLASVLLFELTSGGVAALLSPLLVWAAIRFEQRGAARACFLISVIAIWSTVRGHGPFHGDTVEEGLYALQVFMALTSSTFLILGALTAERRRAREESEAANQAKDRFLAALSHELRTPLTPILALTSVLERDPLLRTETRRRVEVVRRNAELEARLIDDLLDLTRIARGKLKVEIEEVELGDAVDHVLEICRSEAREKGITLERKLGSGRELVARADPARLRQVLWNLVENAIRFTPSGGGIRLNAFSPSPGWVAIEVSDSGRGIEPSEIGRIFHPFEQAGKSAGGLGLGLAISSALVEAQAGVLTASSAGKGLGATFRVELPAGTPTSPIHRQPLAAPSAPPSAAAGRRVLLVEDHLDTAQAVRELLQEMSCQVVLAGTVREAMAAADAAPFDLVMSDIGLPDGSGFDLMSGLRARHGLAGIALTGFGMEQDIEQGKQAGFQDHLVKPITFERLAGAVEKFFAKRPASTNS
jgi:signal transduction histidine kinase/ActR/RegA family two-component response regulator